MLKYILCVIFVIPTILLGIALVFLCRDFWKETNTSKFIKKYFLWLILPLFFLNGLVYVGEFPFWSPIDEGSHFGYIQFLNENKRLPLLTDDMTLEVLALAEGSYPGQPRRPPKERGLGGVMYEAFQPPLYYLISLPFYWVAGTNFIAKIYVLRVWGILQLVILLYLTYRILHNLNFLFYENFYFYTLVALILVGSLPAMITRGAIIGNSLFPVILVSLVILWLSGFARGRREVSPRDPLVLGFFSALAFLSKVTTLFMVPLIAIFFIIERKKVLLNLVLYIFTFLIMISPWLIFNKINYGTFTANEQAQQLQRPVMNPDHKKFGLGYVVNHLPGALVGIWIPEEIGWHDLGRWNPFFSQLGKLLNYMCLVGILCATFFGLRNMVQNHNFIYFFTIFFLLGAIGANLLQLIAVTLFTNWPLNARYLHTVIIALSFTYAYATFQLRYNALTRLLALGLALYPLFINLLFVLVLTRFL